MMKILSGAFFMKGMHRLRSSRGGGPVRREGVEEAEEV